MKGNGVRNGEWSVGGYIYFILQVGVMLEVVERERPWFWLVKKYETRSELWWYFGEMGVWVLGEKKGKKVKNKECATSFLGL